MASYFDSSFNGRKGNFITIPTALSREYKATFDKTISTRAEYDAIQWLAQDRDEWKLLVADIVDKHCEAQAAKVLRQTQARNACIEYSFQNLFIQLM